MTTYLIQILFGATLLLLAALIVNGLLYKAAASLRHRIWTCTLLGLLALPILSPLLPTVHLPLSPTTEVLPVQHNELIKSEPASTFIPVVAERNEPPAPAFEQAMLQPIPAVIPAAISTDETPVDSPKIALRYDIILCAIWLIGTSFLLIHLIISIRSVRKMLASWESMTDPVLDELRRELGVKQPIRLVRSASDGAVGSVPFITGIFRPTIVLPAQSLHWTDPERRAIFTHELVHVVRGDLFWQLVTQIVCAVYWFHPLVWFAAYRIWIERESACDDTVVLRGEKPSMYADLLLELANGLRKQRIGLLGCTVAMTRQNKVSQRIQAILNPNLRRVPLGRVGTALFLGVALAVIVLTAAVSPFAASDEPAIQTESAAQKESAPPREPAAVPLVGDTVPGSQQAAIVIKTKREDGLPARTVQYSLRTGESRPIANSDAAGAFTLEPVTRERLLVISDSSGKRGTIEMLTPAMAGTTQQFTLKPAGLAAVTFIDAKGKPVMGRNVRMRYTFRNPGDPKDMYIRVAIDRTDPDGKAICRILPGKVAVEVLLGDDSDQPASSQYQSVLSKELNVSSGETVDLGVVTLAAENKKSAEGATIATTTSVSLTTENPFDLSTFPEDFVQIEKEIKEKNGLTLIAQIVDAESKTILATLTNPATLDVEYWVSKAAFHSNNLSVVIFSMGSFGANVSKKTACLWRYKLSVVDLTPVFCFRHRPKHGESSDAPPKHYPRDYQR